PVLYIGGGVTAAGQKAANELHKLADATGFPVTSTLMGLGCLPASHKQGLGMLGMYGTLEANKAMHEADLIVAIGARFDDRATGPAGLFAPEAKIVHIDIDPQPIGGACGRRPDLTIKAESGAALRSLNEAWGKGRGVSLSLQPWWQKIEGWRAQQCLSFAQQKGQIMPQQAIRTLSRLTQGWDATIVTGVGQHQMWTAQHYGFEQAGRLITSGGHGSMGYCLPAAIGAQLARPNAAVICVTGDGSFQMNAQEMITATAYGLPIKVLLLNNGKLGMVRQIMKDDYGQPLAETDIGIQPDFAALAKANGWQAGRVRSPSGLTRALSRLLAAKGPALLDCRTAPEEMCYPVIPTGKSHAVIKHNGTRVSP
ncbi:MAG: thiamine pyrophosphate-dependent enzyme, partial [Alphaproteobacteria bacterium]|nr:thiamine pyrophosphate-dependent enzyme [Alphaproteobacteria bacterium]